MVAPLLVVGVVLISTIGSSSGVSVGKDGGEFEEEAFLEFEARFNKVYASDAERTERMAIFADNKRWIDAHNTAMPPRTWSAHINEYADLTFAEFQAQKMGLNDAQACLDHVSTPDSERRLLSTMSSDPAPTSIDWRAEGKVTPAKDQGRCSASWAFAATATVESAVAIKSGVLTSLSEQQLMDCSSGFGNNACKGGLPSQALEYVLSAGGLDTEDAYSYVGSQKPCRYVPSASMGSITAVVNVTQNDEMSLVDAVGRVGPAAISMNVVVGFQFYKSGIFQDPDCSTSVSPTLHAVTAVGYGHDAGTGLDYWLMKNSWGSTWGHDNGFFMIVRGSNECVLAMCASYPIP